MNSHSESNKEKFKSGQDLKDQLTSYFDNLIRQKIIQNFESERNFKHKGFSYKSQYLINFVIETLDNKFILVRSSKSFRSDRIKQPSYDINGVLNNCDISSNVIASIMLFPDSELQNRQFISFRKKVKENVIFSPASHFLVLSEFYEFLENHKASVEAEIEKDKDIIKDGSYYGKAGNALEKEVVRILNNKEYLQQYKNKSCEEIVFNSILDQICTKKLKKEDILAIKSTNTVEKLVSGGNAKTDVIINIITNNLENITETLSVKKSKEKVVSCHDYKFDDFVRVLDVEDTKLAKYFEFFQANPSYKSFEKNLPNDFTSVDFEKKLKPYKEKFTQWVLTGQHDNQNLTNPDTQISKHLLIVTPDKIFCSDFITYINKIFEKSSHKYGVPFSWTYPSKQRTKRIQLKMPILIE